MKLKQFLKPDWRKIVIFIIVFIVLIRFVMIIETFKECGTSRGFPFPYFITMGGLCGGGLIEYGEHFYWGYFILNIIIWMVISYFFSCLIVWIYDKYFKKVKKR